MKVAAFVPLKLENERLPGKNTKPFTGGVPLLQYVLRALVRVSGLSSIHVYCSDRSVKPLLPPGVAFLPRSESLDQPTTRINEVMRAFAEDIEADVYVLAHATAPFMSKESVEHCVSAVVSGDFDSALTVSRHSDFVWFRGGPLNYDTANIPRTQDLEPVLIETTGLYVYPRYLITEENRRVGHRPFLLEVSKVEAIDVNDAIDFEIANAVFNCRSGASDDPHPPRR